MSALSLIVGLVVSPGSWLAADVAGLEFELENLANGLDFLCLDDVLYNRLSGCGAAGELANANRRSLQTLVSLEASAQQLTELLKSENPEVRTLVLVALAAKRDPELLPLIVRMANDEAATFPSLQPVAWMPSEDRALPLEPQTVGGIARRVVEHHLEKAGYFYGIEGIHGQPGFEDYWRLRKDRSYSASWFSVELDAASRGTLPIQERYLEDIRVLRSRIDELPDGDRVWTLLWLRDELGGAELIREDELVEACRNLGREPLLEMLQRRIPSEDPDLKPRDNNNEPYRRMVLFVLKHATQLLRADDADVLLAQEKWERDYRRHGLTDPTITAWWAIAAARLQPERSEEILSAAMERFQERYQDYDRKDIAVAQWQLGGESSAVALIDWFYDEDPIAHMTPNSRAAFIEAVAAIAKPSPRHILERIVLDWRFDALDWQAVQALLVVTDGWLDTPLVSWEERRQLRHPMGLFHFSRQPARAVRDYPDETAEVHRILDRWRSLIRESVPRWSEDS